MYIKPTTLLALMLLLVLTLLVSQSNAHNVPKTSKECVDASSQPSTTLDNNNTQGPADWDSIAHTLGCVFAPDKCKQ